jgi:hypothetical protein
MSRCLSVPVFFIVMLGLMALTPVHASPDSPDVRVTSSSYDASLPMQSYEKFAATKKKKNRQCPEGQNPDPSTGVCFSCSHNDHFENGQCVPCKRGFHEETQADDNGEEQSVCVPDRRKAKANAKNCPEGMEFRNGRCRKSEFPEVEQCPEGQNPDPATGVCFSCSHNDHFENGRCVPCRQGFHVEGDQCVAD